MKFTHIVGYPIAISLSLGLGLVGAELMDAKLAASMPAPSILAEQSVDAIEIARLQQEVAMQQQEIEWLLRMVKAGLSGDMAGHMQAYRAKPSDNLAPQPSATAIAPIEDAKAKALRLQNAQAYVSRVQLADVALQKQALAEGWANEGQLADARRALWQQARDELTEAEYIHGLHGAQLPNVMLVSHASPELVTTAGVARGDVLLTINSVRVFSRDDMQRQLLNIDSSASVEVTLNQQGKTISLVVTDFNKNIEFYGDSIALDKMPILSN
ncbi:hypothetical protein FJQ87_03055 [Shewanella sp. SNU WT4]|uniref:hypothetical protein n=1 Tax=Shewanella sp. SNU WT4 TaxID=2590015 RepID=UPI00112920D4|nr:hypothetical protein [Shewanella sp. SNU WT4]QDF65788.1 hypothetical protein FJQ87_03055 [Shewanella sp. SNU WT4]